ncbi:hypothetical protein OF83DRAFT_786510 [Amylostereum chailletii]|nr:hypothetical protein OF83DRAFT_786510 [Amylostereum chailletii]
MAGIAVEEVSLTDPKNIHGTWGAMFIGVIISMMLYGTTCLQAWNYFIRYYRDPLYLKALAVAVLVTDTVHQILIIHVVYTYLVTNYGNPAFLNQLIWSVMVEVIFNGMTAFLVQGFFVGRLWTLNHRKPLLPTLVGISVLAQFALHFVYAGIGLQWNTVEGFRHVKRISVSINGLTAFTDIIITLSLCYLLHKSRTGFKGTDTLVTRLIIFTINTGLLTSLDAGLSFVLFLTKPDTLIYMSFYLFIGRLYSNSFFATLNARASLRGLGALSYESNTSRTHSEADMPGPNTVNMTKISIKVDTTRDYVRDDQSKTNLAPDQEVCLPFSRVFDPGLMRMSQSVHDADRDAKAGLPRL